MKIHLLLVRENSRYLKLLNLSAMDFIKDSARKISSFLFSAILFCVSSSSLQAQSHFKTRDDSIAKAIRQEEQHKLAGIERLVEATRSFDNLDKEKKYTILAPNNRAFRRLPAQTIDYLIDPAHEAELNDLLAYHTIIGKFSENAIKRKIEKGEGVATFETLSGFPVTAILDKDGGIIFLDKNKRKMKLMEANYKKGDFPVHIIDGVILPHTAVY
jgi:uncharacterized surface protein with fasciclin (FAS1) repeats